MNYENGCRGNERRGRLFRCRAFAEAAGLQRDRALYAQLGRGGRARRLQRGRRFCRRSTRLQRA